MATTTASDIPNSVIELLNQAFILTFQDNIIFNPQSNLISYKESIGGKSMDIADYNVLSPVSSSLTDGTNVTPSAIDDNAVTLTPEEYGDAIETTSLASIQSGGSVDTAASQIVARQASESVNLAAITALKNTSNSFIANSVGAESSLTSSDTIQASDVKYAHNRLRRNNVPRLSDGSYVAIANEDVISDVKNLSDWTDVQKYADAVQVLKYELGMYGGFRWLGTQANAANADAGDTNVDTYDTVFMGAGGLGYGVSAPIRMVFHIPDSPLERKVNVGWYGVYTFKLVKNTSIWMCTAASSYGANS